MKNYHSEFPNNIVNASESAQLIRKIDWSKHQLGAPENWPQTLKIAVSLMLNSQFPMFIAWGPDRIFLYNDAYAPILGQKHPRAFGQTFFENWNEIWDDLLPLIEKVDRGEAVYLEDLKLVMHRHRYGELEETYFTFSYSPIRDEENRICGLFCACVETTQRIRAERELKKSEEQKAIALQEAESSKNRLYSTFMQAPAPLVVLSGENHLYALANPPYEKLVGRQVLGKTVLDVFNREQVGDFVRQLDQVYRTGTPYHGRELPLSLPDSDGETVLRFINVIYHPLREQDGRVTGIIAIHQDVTEQVRARRDIQASEAKFKAYIEALPLMAFLADSDGNMIYHNQRYYDYFGMTAEESGGQNWKEQNLQHPDDLKKTVETWNRSLQTGEPYVLEYRLRDRHGNFRWHIARAVPLRDFEGRITNWIGTNTDIHEQKTARLEYERSVDVSPAILWITETDGSCSYLSKQWYEFTGQTEDQALGFGWLDATHADDKERSAKIFLEANAKRESFFIEYRLRTKSGEYRWAIDAGNPRFDPMGKFQGYAGAVFDIHDHKLAQLAVENSKNAIENERENFRNLFEQTPEMVVITKGPDHIFEFVNEAHVKVLGFNASGMTVRQAQPESIEVHGILDEVYRTGVTAELHEIPITVTNRLRYFNLTYAARRDNDGQVNGIMILGIEVTEEVHNREKIKNTQEQLRQALSSAKLGAWTMDLRSNETHLTEEALQILGLADSSLESIYENLNRVIHPEDRSTVIAALQMAIQYQSPFVSEFRIVRPNGEQKWILSQGEALYDNEGLPLNFNGVLMDTTERKELELNLAASKKAAEEASVAKSRFLANMSHEIRTPLGVMMGFADLALDQPSVSEEVGNYLKAIKRNGTLLTRVIGEVLDLAKIEASKIEIENVRFHLPNLIEEVISFLKVQASERGIHLTLQKNDNLPELIKSDPTRLRQILVNLIGNALKFTEKGSVQLFAQLKTLSGNRAEIEFVVRDTGIGLSQDQQQKLFQPFTQADSSMTRKYGGTGLGLTLSKQLAQAMGGDVKLQESAEDVGSIFVCTIKAEVVELKQLNGASDEVHLAQAQDLQAQSELDGVCVLLVEDSADNQVLFSRYLKSAGAKVALADNGEEGVEKAFEDDYDLILMDIQMPKKNGHEATAELRHRGFAKPIIALTAHALKEERDRAMREGFTDYLTKPLDRRLLIETVRRLTV